jgi:hypothetical protein
MNQALYAHMNNKRKMKKKPSLVHNLASLQKVLKIIASKELKNPQG